MASSHKYSSRDETKNEVYMLLEIKLKNIRFYQTVPVLALVLTGPGLTISCSALNMQLESYPALHIPWFFPSCPSTALQLPQICLAQPCVCSISPDLD